MSRGSVLSIDHPALEIGGGACPAGPGVERTGEPPLADTVPTDRARLGVVLQAAGLLAVLERASWSLQADWVEGYRDPDGRLRGLVARPIAGGRGMDETPVPHRALRGLVRHLFRTEGGIGGRGAGRSAARRLLALWDQDLRRPRADEAVGQVLVEAEFLWEAEFRSARETLAVPVVLASGRAIVWCAGPGWVHRRLEESAVGRSGEVSLPPGVVCEPSVRWAPAAERQRLGAAVPDETAARSHAGRGGARPLRTRDWFAAARRWVETPPRGAAETLAAARCWFAIGRFESTLGLLRSSRGVEAEALRIRCRYQLGDLGAAERRLRSIDPSTLDLDSRIELAETALRVFANRGRADVGVAWLERAELGTRRGRAQSAGQEVVVRDPPELAIALLAAASAWDRNEVETMAEQLEAGAAAKRDPKIAWRWYQLRGLWWRSREEPERALASLVEALRADRRALRPIDAAALWNDLVLCRADVGDLAGAERACLHGIRLLRESEGARPASLFFSNLAEIRLRRGRAGGVEEIVGRALQTNRKAGNLRGLAHDIALGARLDLLRGDPARALHRLRDSALTRLRWNRNERRVLAARALGWLGRAEAARAELDGCDAAAVLDEEEVPALWCFAGDPTRAAGVEPSGVWAACLSGAEPSETEWAELDELPPHRFSRMVYDLERLWPGVVSGPRLLRAAAALRELGACRFASELEVAAGGPWRALERYLESEEGDAARLTELARAIGSADVRLHMSSGGEDRVLVAGRGGERERKASVQSASISLRADEIGSRERVLLELARRELLAPRVEARATNRRRVASSSLLGESRPLRDAVDRLDRLADSDLPILLVGETGTGKELFARRAHDVSARRSEPFLPVNCAALSESLLLSELFGHARGAFTGAERDRAGVFEAALGGTVFLDEIGDLPLAAQGALLRVLQESEVRRVGENRARRTSARVVAATHRDLDAWVAEGRFRADLRFRLRVGFVSLPRLADRGEDPVLLARAFAERAGSSITAEAERRLLSHDWPGNVRELKNVVDTAVVLQEGRPLTAEALGLPEVRAEGLESSYHQQLNDFRRRLIGDAVAACGGNRSRAATRLGLSRQAMSYLVRKLEIPV